jgi:hypothetical protein
MVSTTGQAKANASNAKRMGRKAKPPAYKKADLNATT